MPSPGKVELAQSEGAPYDVAREPHDERVQYPDRSRRDELRDAFGLQWVEAGIQPAAINIRQLQGGKGGGAPHEAPQRTEAK